MSEVRRVLFSAEMAKRYKEFGHIGLNTPFYLLHVDLSELLEPALLEKYNKAKAFVDEREAEPRDEEGPSLTEEIELMRKMSIENARFIAGAQKIFSEEDFMYNYEEHYPDLAEQTHEKVNRGVLGRMSGDYDVPKFMRTKKPKVKKNEEGGVLQPKREPEPVERHERREPEQQGVVPVLVVRKVKGKTKKHR